MKLFLIVRSCFESVRNIRIESTKSLSIRRLSIRKTTLSRILYSKKTLFINNFIFYLDLVIKSFNLL